MSDGLAAVMSRIDQIRAAMGGAYGGVLGVSTAKSAKDTSFERYLQQASADDRTERADTTGATTSASDPMGRIGLTGTGRSSATKGGTATGNVDDSEWPTGLPPEAEQYKEAFLAASAATGVPLRVLLAVAWAESAFDPGAESGVGAQGMMQLMPGTAAGLGVDPSDPVQNIMGGARYLAAQYQSFGSWELAFAAYNAGPGAVEQYGGVPPYRETQNYVAVIDGYLDRLGGVGAPAGSSAAASTAARAAAAGTGASAAPGTTPAAPTALDAQRQAALAAVVPTAVDPAAVSAPLQAAGAPGSEPRLDLRPAALGDGLDVQPGTDFAARAATEQRAIIANQTGGAGDAAQVTASAATLPERIAALVQRGHGEGGTVHRVSLRLDPPDLGTVQVIFELRGEQVHLVVRPERAEGGQLLQAQRDRIATALANSGFELSGFDVGGGAGDPASDATRQQSTLNRAYRALDLDAPTDIRLAVDRELRL